jgi:signal transduction histidine kinase
MLDAVLHFVEQGRDEEARDLLQKALERQRHTIGELRDLSFNLEPVVLRDHGFTIAVEALTERHAAEHGMRVELATVGAESLPEQTQAALYEIVRESLEGAIRRGPPTSFAVHVRQEDDELEVVVADDAPGERRRRSIEVLQERARTLGAELSFQPAERGTTLRLVLPTH